MLNYNDFNRYTSHEGTTEWAVFCHKSVNTGRAMEAMLKRNKDNLYEKVKVEDKDLVIIIDENVNVNYGICVGEFLGIM